MPSREERTPKSNKMGFAKYERRCKVPNMFPACWNKCANLNICDEEEGVLCISVRRT